MRSANGFVTSLAVPQGNTADCPELEPAIAASARRTGVVPERVSTDDGYASAKGRDAVLALKDGFQFGELGRRGLDAVRDELLEKVLAYNCCRSILLRQRQKYNLKQAA